ncbi:MAG: hypothetical protein GX797_05010 [Chloroflexi bacterium]|jgi:hypothetical protein|nr:hypothetical protein [Chloroflexota bacterium]
MSKRVAKVVGGIITLVIGGTAYAITETDVVKNFSKETGMTQQEAQQYVENISEDELVSFEELGVDYITYGQEDLEVAAGIDCETYIYDWQTVTMSCEEGLAQLIEYGESKVALGKAYKELTNDSASDEDIREAIRLIDRFNQSFNSELIKGLFGEAEADEIIKTNLYNKALLQTALDSH